jgi:ABC-type branched-subunit amino acid transport system ATPase component
MESIYSGMTVNERLYMSGLSNDFDNAIKENNIKKVLEIFKRIELNEVSIKPILKGLGLEEK